MGDPDTGVARDATLDALRGIALAGVVLVNLLTEFRAPFLRYIERFHTDQGVANHAVDWIVGTAIEQKALSILTFLFGAGIAALSERFGPQIHRVLLRRFAFLMVLGLLHAVLVFSGDILTLYALTGLVLVPFVRLPTRHLALLACACLLLRFAIPWPRVPVGLTSEVMIAHELAAYSRGTVLDVVRFRIEELTCLIGPLELAVWPRTIALTVIGIVAWREGWLGSTQRRLWSVRLAVAGLLFGVFGTAADAYAATRGIALGRWGTVIGDVGVIGLAGFYGAVTLRLPSTSLFSRAFAPLGRLTLSGYLTQTVLLGGLFYGFGLGLFAKLSSFEASFLALAFYAVQLVLAHAYVARFRVGPVESLWRRVSYGSATLPPRGTHSR